MLGCWDDDSFFFWFVCSWFKHKNCCQHDNTILFRDPNSLLICTPTLYNINPLLFWVSNQKKIRVCRTTFLQPSKSLLRVLIKRMKVCCRDWLPKFATGLNMIIGCSSKIILTYQTVILPKWFSQKGIILTKEQCHHSHTFWTTTYYHIQPSRKFWWSV